MKLQFVIHKENKTENRGKEDQQTSNLPNQNPVAPNQPFDAAVVRTNEEKLLLLHCTKSIMEKMRTHETLSHMTQERQWGKSCLERNAWKRVR